MSNLYATQQAVYQAGAKYHSAMAEYAAALHPDSQSQRLKEEADKCIYAGEEYMSTLMVLLNYVLDEEEIQRIRRLVELLDLEMEQVRRRFRS